MDELQHPTPHNSHEVKTFFEWTAPGRPFVKKGKQYFTTALLIMLFLEIILFLFSQYMLMLVVLSLVFVSFALSSDGNWRSPSTRTLPCPWRQAPVRAASCRDRP